MAKEKLFQVGVKAIIENSQGKVLLLSAPGWKRGNISAHWDIPGGRIQQGHTVLETLEREVEEETGIKPIKNAEFFTAVISNHEFPIDSGVRVGLVLMIYKVEAPSGSQVILSDEHTKYEWVNKSEAAKRLTEKYPAEFTSKLTTS